jgi:hypothetical protein
MTVVLNQGTNSCTTQDWLKATESMQLTAYDPSLRSRAVVEVIEPGIAVNLPPAERARMNRAMPGVNTPPERL